MPESVDAPANTDGQRPTAIIAPLSVCFALGFLFGAGPFSRWQAAIESAQVLARTVRYPEGNAFFEYHLKAWTLLHQALAPWLALGVSERALSSLLSGLMGGLSFVALAMCAYALCKRPLIAILTPLFTLALFGGSDQYGVIYPVFMIGTEHTYGVIGRAMALVLLAMLAMGHHRAGTFLLGMAPAIHPTWGAWSVLVAAAVLAWEGPRSLGTVRKLAPWFAAGVAVSVASLAYQFYRSRGLTEIDPATQAAHLDAFFTQWDFHRRPVNFRAPGIYLAVASVLMSVIWLTMFRKDNSREATFIHRVFVVSGIAGLVGCAVTWIPGMLPDIVNMAMPGRFANLSIFALPAVLLGILGRYQERLAVKVLLMLHLSYVLWNAFFLSVLSSDRFGWSLSHWKEFIAIGAALVLARAIASRIPQSDSVNLRAQRALVPALIIILLSFAAGVVVSETAKHKSLLTSTPDPVLEAAGYGEGLLITAGAMQFVQLRTGRPLLLNVGALDQLSVVPSSGPEMARVLDRVYGIDLFNPPDEIKQARPGGLLPESGRAAWEARSIPEWQEIAGEFGAWDLLAYGDWRLQLPEIARNEEFTLYEIPPPGAPGEIPE